MKYYSTTYKGREHKYDITILSEYQDPYLALKSANTEWSKKAEDIGRLLIVFRKPEGIDDDIKKKDRAFFQFTNSASCMQFINGKGKIAWSEYNGTQIWNGDATFMS